MAVKHHSFLYRMKIRTKIILAVSAIIVVSVSGMIVLATVFFRDDNEKRIKENNHALAEVVALKVRSDVSVLVEKAHFIAAILTQEFKVKNQKAELLNLFFKNDPNIVFAGVITRKSFANMEYAASSQQESFITSQGLKADSFQTIPSVFRERCSQVFGGVGVIENMSGVLPAPLVALAVPLKAGTNGYESIAVVYVTIDRFTEAFKNAGITELFMVNGNGDVIAHADASVVTARGKLTTSPIVRSMLTSVMDNGQLRYEENGVSRFGAFKKIEFGGLGIIASVTENTAFEAVYILQRRNFLIMMIVLCAAILVLYIFGKRLTAPIIRLADATKEIKSGNFRVAITPASGDEIGALTSSFVEMGLGLEERERVKAAFGKFVNKDIAEKAMRGEIKLGGERKNVAVFFSDIRSFTSISEKLEPEEVVEFLNEYMTAMVNLITGSSGVVDKFIGDAIMAVWGAPESRGNDTANAVGAALAMREHLIVYNKTRGTVKKPVIRIGIGINSGPVLAGQIGSEQKLEYTVIGDTVNLASRVETLTKPFGTDILISSDAYALVKDIFVTTPMQKIKVKGKDEAQQVYAVLGRAGDANCPKTIDELRSILGIDPAKVTMNEEDGEKKYEIISQ
ncbi:MAG: adenylate/guanylate cyclase domain-containing protein [Spirochaetes bacterium]|nr:adenylate/guanylate cyclase domain-containing protein [Spirochaetota bacterium]